MNNQEHNPQYHPKHPSTRSAMHSRRASVAVAVLAFFAAFAVGSYLIPISGGSSAQVLLAAESSQSNQSDNSAQHKPAPLAPLPIELPEPVFTGTPKEIPDNVYMKSLKPPGGRGPFIAPADVRNMALHKPVTASAQPNYGSLSLVTNGDKEAMAGHWVELPPGLQWVQVDLKQQVKVYAVVLWFDHRSPRVFHDVIVQFSNDPQFEKNVVTVFNNDYDNSAGMGVGEDYEFFETYQGKLIPVNGKVTARYLRVYTNGSTASALNHYLEFEVWGKPVKQKNSDKSSKEKS